jgi:hypothetical protein
MTNEQTNQPKPAKNQFLTDVNTRLVELLEQLFPEYEEDERNYVREELFSLIVDIAKQSWKNGIEAGKRQAERAKEKGRNPRFRKAEKPVERPAGQAKKSWPKNKYQN